MAFHITPDGPKRCRVDPSNPRSRGCKYGGEHFDQLSSATERFESLMEDATAESLQGVSSTPQMQAVELAQSAGALSAEQSRIYAHWSVANDHLHNGSAIGSPQELFYYSSAQGRLELARRSSRDRSKDNSYEDILRELESYDPQSFEPGLDEERLSSLIADGRAQLQGDSRFLEEKESWNKRRNIARCHYLVEESHRWLSQLSPEQQEAISSLTSDGGAVLHHALGRTAKDGYFPRGLVDEDAIYEAHGADYDGADRAIAEAKMTLSQRNLKAVLSAFEHAPRLEKPTVIARGTTSGELHETLGIPENPEGQRALFDSIEAGEWTGKLVSPEASLRKLPESATLSSSVARSFSKQSWDDENTDDRDILLAIRSKTIASPANVSAWGTGELEVYTNPTSEYRILGGRRIPDSQGDPDSGYFILELEEL